MITTRETSSPLSRRIYRDGDEIGTITMQGNHFVGVYWNQIGQQSTIGVHETAQSALSALVSLAP